MVGVYALSASDNDSRRLIVLRWLLSSKISFEAINALYSVVIRPMDRLRKLALIFFSKYKSTDERNQFEFM